MFPISDSVKSRSFPILTIFFIIINAVLYYFQITSPETFTLQYALTPQKVNFADFSSLIPFVTAMFLHGSILHIISNMWFLWIFGDDVEDYFGKIRFLLFFLVAGIIGNLTQFFLMTDSPIPMLGASGAVSGVLGAYYILFPHSRIKTLLIIFFFITIVEIPAVLYLFYWFFIQLISGAFSLQMGMGEEGGIAFWAHIAGFVVGVLYARAMKDKKERGYIEGEIVG